jgi:hypothetical protein
MGDELPTGALPPPKLRRSLDRGRSAPKGAGVFAQGLPFALEILLRGALVPNFSAKTLQKALAQPMVGDPHGPLLHSQLCGYAPTPCHDVLVFELPLAWTGKTAARLLVLPARGETLSSAWTLWWERSANSFSAVGESGLFGRRGELNAGSSATGFLCHEGGLDVTFTSPDDDLDDMFFDEGVGTRRFLIFLGNEILLGWGPSLVSAGRYTVSVVRAQFGTVRGEHGIGDECWCVQLGDLPMFEWDAPTAATAVSHKVQPRLMHQEVSLAELTKITTPVRRVAARPLGPANLTANRDGVTPSYATGQDVVLDWDLLSEGRDEAEPEVDLECRADQAVLELWAGDVLKGTLYVNRAGPYTITNAVLVAALDAETGFTVRAYLALGGHRSLDYDSVAVWKT